VIASPLNDHACLGPTTDQIVAELAAKNPAFVDLAAQFSNTDDLAAWFRTLPQRDDDGLPGDGPKVMACRPPQRLRLDTLEPNCYERASRFIGTAEIIDPDRVYRLATVTTPTGLHTFPTRDGQPVILDPIGVRNTPRGPIRTTPRTADDVASRRLRIERLIGTDERKGLRGDLGNARRAKALGHTTWVDGAPIDDAIASYERSIARFEAALDELDELDAPGKSTDPRNACSSTEPLVLTPTQAVDRIAEMAMRSSDRVVGGARRIENGQRAMRGVLVLRPICVADVRDVALVLALAEREARTDGLGSLKLVHSTARAIDALDQIAAARAMRGPRNNPFAALALNALLSNKDVQQFAGALTRVAGRIATGVGIEAAKAKLVSIGVSPPVINAFERELNKEGLSLGAFAQPSPSAGSLDAMTPQALAGRWLAQRL